MFQSLMIVRCYVCLLAIGMLCLSSFVLADDFKDFDQTFGHLKTNQVLTASNTPNLQPVFGKAKMFFDHGGKGLTPDQTLFASDMPQTFLNLSGAQVAPVTAYRGEFDLMLQLTGKSAKPANPFASGSHMMLQVELRKSDVKTADGLNLRFYVNGTVGIWSNTIGKSKPRTFKNLGIDRDGVYELVIRHTPKAIAILVDGQEKATYSTDFANDHAGFISFGRSSPNDYNAVKIRSVSVRKIGDRKPLDVVEDQKKKIVPTNIKPIALPGAEAFPKLAIIHAMLWSGATSPRFNRGFFYDKACGFYENAPLAPALPGITDNARITQMRDLVDAGFDTIAIDLFPPRDGPHTLVKWLEAAKKSNTGIRILPCLEPDRRAHVKGKPELNWPDVLADFWAFEFDGKPLRHHLSLVTLPSEGDCVPVFISYSHHHAKTWEQRLKQVHAIGGNAFVISETASIEVAVGTTVPERFRPAVKVASGVYYFGSETVVLNDQGLGILPDFIRFGRSFEKRKVIGATIGPGYIGITRVGNLLSPRGTYVHRTKWIELLKYGSDVDFIHFSTANDYSEATEQECSANSTFTFLDMNKYFLTRWRTGSFPALEKSQAFLSYRKGVAQGEPIQVELVLLAPDVTGDENAQQLASRFNASLQLNTQQQTIDVASVKPHAFPGHVVWNFLHESGIRDSQYATPAVSIRVDGKTVDLPHGRLASLQLTISGEEVARKWLRVPLHRIAPDLDVKVEVLGSPANLYPRMLRLTGLPSQGVAGGLIERYPHPLHTTLDDSTLKQGFTEVFYDGPGFGPMSYKDGWIKRRVIDQLDRYSAVIRMTDGTIAFALPTIVQAPHVDSSVIVDYMPSPGENVLKDRGPMRRDKKLPAADNSKRPTIMQDEMGKPWFLRFDGVDDGINLGRLNMPAGPVSLEVWVRPTANGKLQAINASNGTVMSFYINADMTVQLNRMNQHRKNQRLIGHTQLTENQWHHLVGTYDGREFMLYVNGQPEGKPVRCLGVKTDEMSALGCFPSMSQQGQFQGDLARFCVRQKALIAQTIEQMYHEAVVDFK